MTVPAHDISNIVDFLMKKEDKSNNYQLRSDNMEYTFYADPPVDFLNEEWPSNSDDLLDIFSLDSGPFNLLDNASELGLCMEPLVQKPGSLPGSGSSDSGLSSDQTDVDVFDQQLSPFLIHNSFDEETAPTSVPSPTSSSLQSVSSPPSMSQSPMYVAKTEVEPTTDVSEDIDVVGFTNTDLNESHLLQSVQLNNNRKRKPSIVPISTAVVQPKIQKNSIVKPIIKTQKVNPVIASNPVTTNIVKPKLIVSAATNQHVGSIHKMGSVTIARQPINFQASDGQTKQRKVIRVAPMAGNSRSILLPVTIKDMKDFRSIKIINASDLKNTANLKIAAANLLQQTKQNGSMNIGKNINNRIKVEIDNDNYVMDDSNSDISDDDETSDSGGSPKFIKNQQYPRLVLSAEERKLLSKEGITLPTSYPLTKHEERELKRIRRKIRNKISAQDSRKRKKEYVDGLEDRVKQCSAENQTLMKRIKVLQTQNHLLASHLKKLQNALTKSSAKTTQPATCLLVLLLSVALVAVPSLRPVRPNDLSPTTGQTASESDAAAIRRALLSAHTPTATASDAAASSDEFVTVDDYSAEELVLPYEQPPSDHDYPMSKAAYNPVVLPGGFMDIPLDEEWPPNKKPRLERPVFDLDDGSDNLPFMINNEVTVKEEISQSPAYDRSPLKDLSVDDILAGNDKILSVGGKLNEIYELEANVLKLQGQIAKLNDTKKRSIVLTNGI